MTSPNFWRNLGAALWEAMITLAITQVPIFLALVIYALGEKSATLGSALNTMLSTLSPGDVLGYSTGILASSTAYALIKIGSFRTRPALMITLILFPMIVIMAAMPIYIQDMNDQIKNLDFARSYASTIILLSAILWIYALYQSRAFFEIRLSDEEASQKIVDEIEG